MWLFAKIVEVKLNKWVVLGLIFVIALAVRFYAFRESIYFGFDNARDAYISQDIYLKGDFKFIGPPVSGDVGLFHGPLYWYLIGPIFLLFKGDPAMVSMVFRVLNALGIFLVFAVTSSLFTPFVGYLTAFFYAISFEESQYSLYVGNPGLGVLTILLIFLGAILIYKKDKRSIWSPLLMLGGAAVSTQMNLMFVYTFMTVVVLILLLRKQAAKIAKKFWLIGLASVGLILSTYILVEFKYKFRSFVVAYKLFKEGYGVMDTHQSKYILFLSKYLRMFRDNLLGIDNYTLIGILAVLISAWVIYMAIKNKAYRILMVWLFSWVFLMFLGGHTAYYTNAGLGIAVLTAAALLIEKIFKWNKAAAAVLVMLIVFSNLRLVWFQQPNSLITEFQPQPMMKLTDEYKIIDEMYKEANGRGFTVRMTGVPYRVQTVWSYLFHFYALKKYGYLPYWELGNALGFPGEMPVPKTGTTCLRFLGREPMRGLPAVLVDYDEGQEKNFSSIVKKIDIGEFTLETRLALDKKCHNDKPTSLGY